MNIRKSVFLTSVAGLFGTLGLAAHAQEQMQPKSVDKPAFKEIDKNADGVITESEARETWLATIFERVDVNRDGYVTEIEYKEARS
jgi:Ca2+-binding EF-hand superfamily protein